MWKVLLLCALLGAPSARAAAPDADSCPRGLTGAGRRAWLAGAGVTALAAYLGWRFLANGSGPTLFLVEEDHDSEAARATMRSLGARGLRGEVLVGYENLLHDGNRPVQQRSFRALSGAPAEADHTIHGLEASVVHAGVELFLMRGQFASVVHAPGVASWTGFLTGLGVVLRDNPHQARIWKEKLDGAASPPSLKGAYVLITSAEWLAQCEATSAEAETQAFRRRARMLEGSRFFGDRALTADFATALLSILREYVDFMSTPEARRQYETPASLRRLLLSPEPARADFEDAVLRWRNERMMEAIERLWADAQKSGKDLYLVVGAQHRPGLERLIQARLSPGGAFRVVNRVDVP